VTKQNTAGLSRRALIGGALGMAASMTSRIIVGAETAGVPATVGGSTIKLRVRARRDSDVTGSIPSNAPVNVIEGPTPDGWYRVEGETKHGSQRGWTHGDGLVFAQSAVFLWDAGVFSGPTDATGWLATIRHGVVVTVAGPGSNGFTFIRFGGLQGYVAAPALQLTDQPATDPLGEWWADVNRSTLTVNLMIGSTIVDSFPAAMSTETGAGFYSTAPGTYWIYEKVAGLQYTPYAKAYFMYWCGFDPNRYNGFHSWTMDGNGYVLNGGWGNTAGCVATEPKNAAVIYNFLSLNSRIEIHW
jgi:L,D-transpeptidase-like protein/SH3 domain-containing protein